MKTVKRVLGARLTAYLQCFQDLYFAVQGFNGKHCLVTEKDIFFLNLFRNHFQIFQKQSGNEIPEH